MAEEAFSLPGSSYKQIEKIITSYEAVGGETGPAEVASLAGTDVTNVSRNNKFLVATGLIQGKQKKAITPLGEKLAKAIEYQKDDVQSECWSEVVEKTEFLQKILSAVRIRRGMDSATLVNHIAFSAGAAKNAATMAGSGAILDILLKAGSLTDEGGMLVVSKEKQAARSETPQAAAKVPVVRGSDLFFKPSGSSRSFFSDFTSHEADEATLDVRLNINLQIECAVSDLDELAPRLNNFIEKLRLLQAGSKNSPGSADSPETREPSS